MTEMILDLQSVSEVILSKISSQKVKLSEDNGSITLTPWSEEKTQSEEKHCFEHWIGRFAGKMSVDDFLAIKREDRKLEP